MKPSKSVATGLKVKGCSTHTIDRVGQNIGSITPQLIHLSPGEVRCLPFDRSGWLQLTRGEVLLNGQKLEAGDGVAIAEEQKIAIEATTNTELLLFDMA